MAELNRDLLLAVLAATADASSRPGLSAALDAWSRDTGQSLSELIRRECRIADDGMRRLEARASDLLRDHSANSGSKPAESHGHDRTLDVPTEAGESLNKTLRDGVGSASGAGNDADQTVPDHRGFLVGADFTITRPPAELSKSDRFEPISEYARGGIGLVYLARDGELQREVALKVIQDRFAHREDQLARFLLEAEITGNLEHPGIVPVTV